MFQYLYGPLVWFQTDRWTSISALRVAFATEKLKWVPHLFKINFVSLINRSTLQCEIWRCSCIYKYPDPSGPLTQKCSLPVEIIFWPLKSFWEPREQKIVKYPIADNFGTPFLSTYRLYNMNWNCYYHGHKWE